MSIRRNSLMGPAILITLGVLFMLHEMRPDIDIGRTWPVILIVIGLIRIIESFGSGAGPGATPPPVAGPTPPGPGALPPSN